MSHIDQNASGRQLGAYKSAAKKTGCSLEQWLANRTAGLNWCFRCREWKDHRVFVIDASRAGGRAASCRECTSKATTRTRYNLTCEEIETLKTTHCPICERPEQIMVIDHNHQTGAVRAMICSRCNVGLGLFCDDPDLLARAVQYLEKYRG